MKKGGKKTKKAIKKNKKVVQPPPQMMEESILIMPEEQYMMETKEVSFMLTKVKIRCWNCNAFVLALHSWGSVKCSNCMMLNRLPTDIPDPDAGAINPIYLQVI